MPSGSASRRNRPARGSVAAARRGPSTGIIIAVVVLVLFAGAVGFGIYRAQRGSGDVPVPAGGTSTGITVGQASAPATIDIYLDFQCPICKQYETQNGPTIDKLVGAGQAKVVYHPVAFLDRFSSTQYSSRSSAASACAADAKVFPQYLTLLYANQPPENGDGLPESQLVSLGQQAGAGGDFAQCVQDNRYANWTKSVTDDASRAGVNGTPTIKVNGTDVGMSTDALTAAVAAAQR
ncbi:MAG TPA: thioredoxin domain-containing protein [Pseudonocardia sp.]|jgi:protein-disulfide isomerase